MLFSQVAVYNAFAVRDLEMPNEIANVVLKEPKRFLGSVIRNEDIPGFKKYRLLHIVLRGLFTKLFILLRKDNLCQKLL